MSHGEDVSVTSAPRLNALNSTSIVLVSASVIALQIVLMRSLAITRYHHFSYLVIGTALLGFGLSGTMLTFLKGHLTKHFMVWSPLSILFFSISIPLMYHLAESLPIDIQYVLFSLRQIVLLFLYMTLILMPFFFGALFIGLALVNFRNKVPIVYGLNLFGSGAGGGFAVLVLYLAPATSLPDFFWIPLLPSLVCWLLSSGDYWKKPVFFWTGVMLFVGIAGGVLFAVSSFPVNTDKYKAISHIRLLENQEEATEVMTKIGPRGVIDVFSSVHFHNALFAGPNADVLPPDQYALLIDGNMAGSVFRIDSPEKASILDYTPQSLPYRLVASPKVLLLGEVSGTNIWLAKRYGASSITVVQGNSQLKDLLSGDLKGPGGEVLSSDRVRAVLEEPYLFVHRTDEKFDIIHIVEGENISAGVSGLKSLHEDYLLTVESIARCYDILTERGFIALTRGIQAPPRDNLKIFALFASALEHAGVRRVERQLMQSRNYLAATTLIAKSPIENSVINKVRAIAGRLLLDTEYYPGIDTRSVSQVNHMAGPEGAGYSYLHYGDMKILSEQREGFFDDWIYNVVPPTNSRPYFFDFFKWRSLPVFMKTYGKGWLQQLEVGYVVLVVSFLETMMIAFICTILPLAAFRSGQLRSKPAGAVLVYFLALGIAFMLIEMVFIHKLTRFLGDPIFSATATITAVLVFAGVGSMAQSGEVLNRMGRVRLASVAVIALVALYLFGLDKVLPVLTGLHIVFRFTIVLLVLAPLSFFMGWMFPNGLSILEKDSRSLIPWAWGINGFASVIAAPLSVMISMSCGFGAVLLIAASLYALSGYAVGLFSVK